jgi:predicted amidohydrolase
MRNTTLRIALATPPFPKSIDDGLSHVEALTREAAGRGARIVCFPESYIPGYHGPEGGEVVAPCTKAELEAALERARMIAKQSKITLVLPMDWHSPDGSGVLNVAMVISPEGEVLGHQAKVQLDPTEDTIWVAGRGRQVFELADGVKFGVVICHEGFRYPETVRWAARRGAQVVFHPYCAGDNYKGRSLTTWHAPTNPYYESAMMCRALENTIYFASVNYGLRHQDAASSVVGPMGELVAHQPYNEAGVLVVDLDLTRATGLLASRCREC